MNRQDHLENLLNSMIASGFTKMIRVLVIDSTFNPDFTSRNIQKIKKSFHFTSEVYEFLGGLPSARNFALEKLDYTEKSLVHFFDDDITIPLNYFFSVDRFFSEKPFCFGAGPLVSGYKIEKYTSHFSHLYEKLGARQDIYAGKVTSSNANYWVSEDSKSSQLVDWIPGCSMIYRSEIFKFFRFNPHFDQSETGYRLGEDKDFSWRVSRHFQLQSLVDVTIEHHLAPSSRDDRLHMFKSRAYEAGYFSKLTNGYVSIWHFLLVELLHDLYPIYSRSRRVVSSLLFILKNIFYIPILLFLSISSAFARLPFLIRGSMNFKKNHVKMFTEF